MNFDPIARDYDSSAHKLLSDQRLAYFAQSAQSRFGEVAPFTHTPARSRPLPNAPLGDSGEPSSEVQR